MPPPTLLLTRFESGITENNNAGRQQHRRTENNRQDHYTDLHLLGVAEDLTHSRKIVAGQCYDGRKIHWTGEKSDGRIYTSSTW